MYAHSFIKAIKPGLGQESVWDYPRPPRIEPTSKRIEIIFNGKKIVDTIKSVRVLETSHPPVYYIPREDIQMQYLVQLSKHTFCEFKGIANYFDLIVEQKIATSVAWSYPEVNNEFEIIKNFIGFYAGPMDGCFVNGEKVIPQPGTFYAGWITSDIVGPFKGESGSWGW
eukprot:TRINITY_DN24_c0_g1_i1.p1 TRINITY_DN24_c0_g1~~TRINITY_DN24_c0_g1_i1.p1  ORF type:complete len:183 (+),score=89.28 TRINITY_DN24_c0_g1_i1:44-550(+)